MVELLSLRALLREAEFITFLPSATYLQQGYVFTGVGHSAHRGGVADTPLEDTPWQTPLWADTLPLGRHPPGRHLPPGRHPVPQTLPPDRHSPGQTPPWADTPWADTHCPVHIGIHLTPPPRRPLQRTVRILLECILVHNACAVT